MFRAGSQVSNSTPFQKIVKNPFHPLNVVKIVWGGESLQKASGGAEIEEIS